MLSKCWARSRPATISKYLVEACSSTQLLASLADLVIDFLVIGFTSLVDLVIDFLVIGFEEHPLSLSLVQVSDDLEAPDAMG